MSLDPRLLREAREARNRARDLQHGADQAQIGYQHSIRQLHAAGGSLREIGDALELSYQRVHQIVDVAAGKGAVKERPADAGNQICSFCGVGTSEVSALVAGPGLFICSDCVGLATVVLASAEEAASRSTRFVSETRPGARCGFCGKQLRAVAGLVAAPDRAASGKLPRRHARRFPGVRICSECVTLCGEILAEWRA